VSGPCTDCGRDSSDAKKGGGLWQPADSDPVKTRLSRGRDLPRALCTDCRTNTDDGVSPWRSA
jgi:hypothetical protein